MGKDTRALQILQSSLPNSVFRKTLEAASAKHLWDLLKESDEQAKLEKQFQQLIMEKREGLSSYIDKVAEMATDPRFAGAKSRLKSTTKLISLSDSIDIDGAAPVMDQLMGLQSLTFNNFRELLHMFESVAVETLYENLRRSIKVGSSGSYNQNVNLAVRFIRCCCSSCSSGDGESEF